MIGRIKKRFIKKKKEDWVCAYPYLITGELEVNPDSPNLNTGEYNPPKRPWWKRILKPNYSFY